MRPTAVLRTKLQSAVGLSEWLGTRVFVTYL